MIGLTHTGTGQRKMLKYAMLPFSGWFLTLPFVALFGDAWGDDKMATQEYAVICAGLFVWFVIKDLIAMRKKGNDDG